MCSTFICTLHLADLKWSFWAMQVESQLELAKGLSESLDNSLFLKREDLQPVRPPIIDPLHAPSPSALLKLPCDHHMDGCCARSC